MLWCLVLCLPHWNFHFQILHGAFAGTAPAAAAPYDVVGLPIWLFAFHPRSWAWTLHLLQYWKSCIWKTALKVGLLTLNQGNWCWHAQIQSTPHAFWHKISLARKTEYSRPYLSISPPLSSCSSRASSWAQTCSSVSSCCFSSPSLCCCAAACLCLHCWW